MRKLLIVTTEMRRIKCKINTEINKAFINKNFLIIKCYFTKKRKTSSFHNNGHIYSLYISIEYLAYIALKSIM